MTTHSPHHPPFTAVTKICLPTHHHLHLFLKLRRHATHQKALKYLMEHRLDQKPCEIVSRSTHHHVNSCYPPQLPLTTPKPLISKTLDLDLHTTTSATVLQLLLPLRNKFVSTALTRITKSESAPSQIEPNAAPAPHQPTSSAPSSEKETRGYSIRVVSNPNTSTTIITRYLTPERFHLRMTSGGPFVAAAGSGARRRLLKVDLCGKRGIARDISQTPAPRIHPTSFHRPTSARYLSLIRLLQLKPSH